jgi:hypothetical protein
MKNITLKVLYKLWNYLASRNKCPKLCEKLNLWINLLESK